MPMIICIKFAESQFIDKLQMNFTSTDCLECMFDLPIKNNSFVRLSQVYKNTVATYKFYWFISIVELFCLQEKRKIDFGEIIIRMIANAWYPIHYFRLSFGRSDSLYQAIISIHNITGLPIDSNKEEIHCKLLNEFSNPEIIKCLRVFSLNVPYRFLSPWIGYTNDIDVILRSQTYENNCPYEILIDENEKYIVINPSWEDYLKENYKIILDFSYWNLAMFLQARNPNVPDIPNKLVKQIERNSLTRQRNFWNSVFDEVGSISCIYTNKTLIKGGFDVDHFIPWSFVSHDLLWNLLPVDSSINSSKSNKLPDIRLFLPEFAEKQHLAIKTIYAQQPSNQLLEDYQSLGASVYDLIQLKKEDFYTLYYKTMSPMVQIAENMGFEYWDFQSVTYE